MKPSCFVIMPFGHKKYKLRGSEEKWIDINFDDVYAQIMKPAIIAAGMDPVRADEEKVGGSIHKPMFERIILSDYVIADLTGANANVFYELGIRHAVKPYTSISIFSDNCDLPFDLSPFRTIPYKYSPETGLTNATDISTAIAASLRDSKINKTTDSPIYQLVDCIKFQNSVAHEKTDIFRDKVEYDETLKAKLKEARRVPGNKMAKLQQVEEVVNNELQPLADQEAGVLIDAMLSYRDVSAFEQMEAFILKLPRHIQQTVMVQEQYGFALNRNKKRLQAADVLEKVIKENGPSSETYGILGRVYKDLSEDATAANNIRLAKSHRIKAIDSYLKGFEADWRDAYPGINALTLLEVNGDKQKIIELAPVVAYAVNRKLSTKTPDYWDYATLLEIAVIANNRADAEANLEKAIGCPIEAAWMFETTINNLNLIVKTRQGRNEDFALAEEMSHALKEQINLL